jgi:hypothetical protein
MTQKKVVDFDVDQDIPIEELQRIKYFCKIEPKL